MGKITLKNMRFYGYHGVLEEEKKLGQEFAVDIVMILDTTKAIQTDNVEDTIDYSRVYIIAKEIIENENFNLLEALAGRIVNDIKKEFSNMLLEIKVTVRKPSAPINGIFDYAEVEIRG